MISKSWLYLISLMFLGDAITAWTGSILISVICDLVILGIGYFILRRDPFMDFKSNMIFLTCLTIINILRALGLISSSVTNEAFFALLIWSFVGIHHRFFRYFIIGSVIFNGVGITQNYRNFGYLDIPTIAVSLIALLIVAYVDRNHF